MTKARASRFAELCREAGEQLGLPPDHDKAKLVATIRCALEQEQAKMMLGQRVDAPLIAKLIEMLDTQIPPPPPPPIKMPRIEIIAKCLECSKEFDTKDIPEDRSDSDKLPRTIEGEIVKPADATPTQSDAKPAPKAAAKPEKLFEPSRNFHAGAPLRNGNEPWRAHVRGNG
jgi:hypothetical protein